MNANNALPPLRGRTLASLLVAQVGQSLTFVMVAAVLPQIATYFGGGARGELVAQQMAVFPFLGLTAGGLLSGLIIARTGLRTTAIAAAAVYLLAGLVPIFVVSATPMLGASFALGFAASLLTSSISGSSGELISHERLEKFVSYQVALAILSGAVLGMLTGYAALSWGWRAAFVGYAGMGSLILLLLLVGLPDAKITRTEIGLRVATMLRLGWRVNLLGALTFVIVTLGPTYLPFLMNEHGITSSAIRGSLVTVQTGSAFIGSIAYAQLQGRLSPRHSQSIAALLLALGYCLFASWTGPIAVIVLALAMSGFGAGMVMPALFAGALSIAPKAGGQSVGFLNVAIFMGSFSTPYLLSPLRQAFGLQGMLWCVCAAITLTGIATLAMMRSDSLAEA